MLQSNLSCWDGNPSAKIAEELMEIQKVIASRVSLKDDHTGDAVAGVDQAFLEDLIISGAVVLQVLELADSACYIEKASIPYVPGFLSFREGPAAIKALRRLKIKPTLVFIDGCGINHPRMAGLASYVGVILDIPTIGISKNALCGCFDTPTEVGEANPLVCGEKVAGYVLKSKKGCRPIIVAPGHKVSVDSSLELAQQYLKSHKLPEPCRLAHEYANRVKTLCSSKDLNVDLNGKFY